jgi:peptide/nickel transport system ATP-binding protein
MTAAPVLRVDDLHVSFTTPGGRVDAVNGVSFEIAAGRTLGIVGESGSGKSVTAASIMGLSAAAGGAVTGSIEVAGTQVLGADEAVLRSLRGREMAMVFQDPMSALNPYYTVGSQIAEAYAVHHPSASKRERREAAMSMMEKVGIPNPGRRIDEYPHQFSGGMRQRIVIAIALANNPKLLIADEPTTALDVTVQAQILDLMRSLQDEYGSAIVLITHDLGVVAEMADDVVVMYAGRVVERATCDDLFATPTHPYTLGLMGAVRSLDDGQRGQLRTVRGTPPSLIDLPAGCAFRPRCEFALGADEACGASVPGLRRVGDLPTLSACHLPDTTLLELGARRSA